MSNTFFAKIIRQIQRAESASLDTESEKLVIYRPTTGEFFYEKRSTLENLVNSSDEYYLVNHSRFEKVNNIMCEVYDKHTGAEIKLRVTGLIGSFKGKERKLVKLFRKSKRSDDTISRLFVNWTNAITDTSELSLKKDFTEIYSTLCRRYEDYAQSLGIRLQIVRIDLDDELGEFLNSFSFSTKDNNYGGGRESYKTKESDIDIKLNVHIQGKGDSLSGNVVKHNRQGVSLIGEIKRYTIDTIQEYVRKITPEEVYMSERDKTLNLIANDIRKMLRSEFNVKAPNISITALNTEPKTRLDELREGMGTVEVINASKEVHFEIKYRIVGVCDWFRFISNQKKYYTRPQSEYLDISNLLKDGIELKLNKAGGFPIELVKTVEFDNIIKGEFKRIWKDIIEVEFGLLSGEPHLKRHTIEEEESRRLIKYDILKEKKALLMTELREEILSDSDSSVITDIEKRIDACDLELRQLGGTGIKQLSQSDQKKLLDESSSDNAPE